MFSFIIVMKTTPCWEGTHSKQFRHQPLSRVSADLASDKILTVPFVVPFVVPLTLPPCV